MQTSHIAKYRVAVSALLATLISACGGGSHDASTQLAGSVSAAAPDSTMSVQTQGGTAARIVPPSTVATGTVVPTATTAAGITQVQIQNTSAVAQSGVPVTFGQVFAVGHVPTGDTVTGQLANGSALPLQVDVKARHPDGSIRHAIISAVLPQLAASATETIALVKTVATTTVSAAAAAPTTPTALLNNGFKASATITLNGVQYTASADALLAGGRYATWLSGPIVNEWHVSAPLTSASGTAHPHLTARFAIRAANGA
ncbi:MAG: hypothetical protein ACLGI6_14570, partial [Gammaproteobacteria bacterium]